MASATQIATRALKRLQVVPAGGVATAADMADAIEALEALIASWESVALSGDILPLDARFEQGIVAMLAVRLAGDYGKSPDPILMRDAEEGRRALEAAFFAVPPSRFESALLQVEDIILGQTGDNYAPWQTSTAYRLRQYVIANGHVYECSTAGTSAGSGSGPSGTDTEITDGTAVWCWRRVDGDPVEA